MRCWVAGALALSIGCGAAGDPAPLADPPRALGPLETALRYDPPSDAWREIAGPLAEPGLYAIEALGEVALVRRGPGCAEPRAAEPPPGRMIACVPTGDRGELREISAPPRSGSPLCTRPGQIDCVGIRATVTARRDPFSDADLAGIRAAWRAFLIALAERDTAALDRPCGRFETTFEPARFAAVASRFDATGLALHEAPGGGGVVHAFLDSEGPSATPVDLVRSADGRWAVCATWPGE